MNKRVLVLGTDNSIFTPILSQLIKHLTFKKVDVEGAGVKPKGLHEYTKKVLLEMGIDMSEFDSKSISEFAHTHFDIIITTSIEAKNCLHILMDCKTKIHKEFDDPTLIAKDEIQMQNAFRSLRDEMNEWLNEFLSRHRLVKKV